MVPGMAERERLAADAQRLQWLAEARLGPIAIGETPLGEGRTAGPPLSPLRVRRLGLAVASLLGQRFRPRSFGFKAATRSPALSAPR